MPWNTNAKIEDNVFIRAGISKSSEDILLGHTPKMFYSIDPQGKPIFRKYLFHSNL